MSLFSVLPCLHFFAYISFSSIKLEGLPSDHLRNSKRLEWFTRIRYHKQPQLERIETGRLPAFQSFKLEETWKTSEKTRDWQLFSETKWEVGYLHVFPVNPFFPQFSVNNQLMYMRQPYLWTKNRASQKNWQQNRASKINSNIKTTTTDEMFMENAFLNL